MKGKPGSGGTKWLPQDDTVSRRWWPRVNLDRAAPRPRLWPPCSSTWLPGESVPPPLPVTQAVGSKFRKCETVSGLHSFRRIPRMMGKEMMEKQNTKTKRTHKKTWKRSCSWESWVTSYLVPVSRWWWGLRLAGSGEWACFRLSAGLIAFFLICLKKRACNLQNGEKDIFRFKEKPASVKRTLQSRESADILDLQQWQCAIRVRHCCVSTNKTT